MLTDIEITRKAKKLKIDEIGAKLNIDQEALIHYGNDKAKVDISYFKDMEKNGKLVLVTSINPTAAGEGKSTTTVGLVDSLNNIGINTVGCLREPSVGPVFGLKGGAAGGGYSQVIPMEDINLHFTGDMHAITTANNLICACIDNHIFHGNELNINPDKITFNRCLDINDRNLRNIRFKDTKFSVVRDETFKITVASEIMAILCLSKDLNELKSRVDDITFGYDINDKPLTVKQLDISGSIAVLLKDAIKPNLVQTLENNPIFIHGGPFANIAHGCNSLIATNTALKLADVVVTEAGFGADLGFEKFLDIKSRTADLQINLVVVVATIRALKMHGGLDKNELQTENLAALEKGFCNLEKHIEFVKSRNLNCVVVINKFSTDTDAEVELLTNLVTNTDTRIATSNTFAKGSEGGIEMANLVKDSLSTASPKYVYDLNDSVVDKISKIATTAYGAKGVIYLLAV